MEIHADFKQIHDIAFQIGQGPAKEINLQIKEIYKRIQTLGTSKLWTGSRFNDLAKAVNNMIPGLNQLITVISKEVPESLVQVACNYQNADVQGGERLPQLECTLEALPEVTVTELQPLNFDLGQVDQAREAINGYFGKVQEAMNDINTKMTQISNIWNSPAAESYKQKFNNIQTQINDTIQNLMEQFSKSLQQTMEDLSKADEANDVNRQG